MTAPQPSTTNHVRIFDTTLRDGEQAPGFSMTGGQKLRMAHALSDLGVDIIEAGFAAASPGDFEAVERISAEVTGPTICSLARCFESDIRDAGRALKSAEHKRIHLFIATSPIHRKDKLNMTKEEVVVAAVAAIGQARDLADEIGRASCRERV